MTTIRDLIYGMDRKGHWEGVLKIAGYARGVCRYHSMVTRELGCTVQGADGYHSKSYHRLSEQRRRGEGGQSKMHTGTIVTIRPCRVADRAAIARLRVESWVFPETDINLKTKATSTNHLFISSATKLPVLRPLPTFEVSKRFRKCTVHTGPADSNRRAKASGS